ncbi:hypothetical protein LCGC14_1022100 [marine sediment metagenome]|uniref:Uncharacterized protein n=1 Tax=marine sediment metagenome TaxID=412755 RepID=A0A0F9R317_9ZZZZ
MTKNLNVSTRAHSVTRGWEKKNGNWMRSVRICRDGVVWTYLNGVLIYTVTTWPSA